MKKCPKCGKEADVKFCPECGSPMEENSQSVVLDGSSIANADQSDQQQPYQTYMPEPPKKYGLSQQTWFVVLFLIIFWPVGLYLMWSRKKFTKVARIIITIVLAILVIIGVSGIVQGAPATSDNSATEESVIANAEEPTTESTTEATTEPAKATEAKFDANDYKNIAYKKLARDPDKYEYELVKNSGKVIQVMEGDGSTQLRVAIDDDYDKVVYLEYDSSITKSRVLEDDNVTYYGISAGLVSYESTMSGNISIPGVYVTKIKIK